MITHPNQGRRSILRACSSYSIRLLPAASLLSYNGRAMGNPAAAMAIISVANTVVSMSSRRSDQTLATLMALREEVQAIQARLDEVDSALQAIAMDLNKLPDEVARRMRQELDRQSGDRIYGIKQQLSEAKATFEVDGQVDNVQASGRYSRRLESLLAEIRSVRSSQFSRADETCALTLCVAAWTELDLLGELKASPFDKKVSAAAYVKRLQATESRDPQSIASLTALAREKRETAMQSLKALAAVPEPGQRDEVGTRLYCASRGENRPISKQTDQPFRFANFDPPIKTIAFEARKGAFVPSQTQEAFLTIKWSGGPLYSHGRMSVAEQHETKLVTSRLDRVLHDKPLLSDTKCNKDQIRVPETFEQWEKRTRFGPRYEALDGKIAALNAVTTSLAALLHTRRAVASTVRELHAFASTK